jgi:hypothetical protein
LSTEVYYQRPTLKTPTKKGFWVFLTASHYCIQKTSIGNNRLLHEVPDLTYW